jgi:hypothetical protein
MDQPASPSVLPVAWTDILENVLTALRTAEADAARREHSASLLFPPVAQEQHSEALWQQLTAWPLPAQPSLQAGTQQVADADAGLRDVDEALRGWLATAERNQRTLTDWVERKGSGSQ